MRHVIAGQTDDDVIEWRLELDAGEPLLKAKKGGNGWYSVAFVSGDELFVTKSGASPLGLTPSVIG